MKHLYYEQTEDQWIDGNGDVSLTKDVMEILAGTSEPIRFSGPGARAPEGTWHDMLVIAAPLGPQIEAEEIDLTVAIRSMIVTLEGALVANSGDGLEVWNGRDGDVRDVPPGGALLGVSWANSEHSYTDWYPTTASAKNALLALARAHGCVPDDSGMHVDLTAPGCHSSGAWVTRRSKPKGADPTTAALQAAQQKEGHGTSLITIPSDSFNPRFGFARLPDGGLLYWETRGREGSRDLIVDASLSEALPATNAKGEWTSGWSVGRRIDEAGDGPAPIERWLREHGAVAELMPAELFGTA